MSTYFFYEDGQGKLFDEKGNDAMKREEDVNPPRLETITNIRCYCNTQELEQASIVEDLDAKLLADGTAPRTVQKWTKRPKDKNWNIFEKQTNKVNRRKPQLEKKHKEHLVNFYDDHPQARVDDAAAREIIICCAIQCYKNSVGIDYLIKSLVYKVHSH